MNCKFFFIEVMLLEPMALWIGLAARPMGGNVNKFTATGHSAVIEYFCYHFQVVYSFLIYFCINAH